MDALKLRGRDNFEKLYLLPALEADLIERTIPDKPNSRLQKYRLTDKGLVCLPLKSIHLEPTCQHWLGKLANLNAARTASRGIAPHKPLMLLTIIDLIESGDVPDGWVKYDVRLVSRFRDYWELVLERQRNQPDIPMPFHALGGDKDKVWERFTAEGQPSKAKTTTRLCSLDPDLFACVQDADFRRKARETLVTLYFTAKEQVMLCARLGLPVPQTAEIDALRQHADEFKARQKKGRDSRFKSDVLGGYYFTCALTGYRLDTETTSIVQAAHIHQHALSGNDDPPLAERRVK